MKKLFIGLLGFGMVLFSTGCSLFGAEKGTTTCKMNDGPDTYAYVLKYEDDKLIHEEETINLNFTDQEELDGYMTEYKEVIEEVSAEISSYDGASMTYELSGLNLNMVYTYDYDKLSVASINALELTTETFKDGEYIDYPQWKTDLENKGYVCAVEKD